MFSFFITGNDVKKISSLSTSFIDVVFSKNKVTLLVTTAEGSCLVTYPAVNEGKESTYKCRIDYKLFVGLAKGGLIRIEDLDSHVGITFHDESNVIKYKGKMIKQTCSIDMELLELILDNIESSNKYDLSPYGEIIKMATRLNETITSDNDFIYCLYQNAILFCKNTLPMFSCSAKFLFKGLTISNTISLIDRYIVFNSDNFLFMVVRSKFTPTKDIKLISSHKNIAKYNCDLGPLVLLSNSVKDSEKEIILDLSGEKGIVNSSFNEFTCSLACSKIIKEEDLGSAMFNGEEEIIEHKVKVPSWICKHASFFRACKILIRKKNMVIVNKQVNIILGGGLIV